MKPWRSKEQDIDFQNVHPKLISNIFYCDMLLETKFHILYS